MIDANELEQAEARIAHLRGALQNKMRYQMAIRDQLVAAALRFKVLPDHADTHMECYSDSQLIDALVAALEAANNAKQ